MGIPILSWQELQAQWQKSVQGGWATRESSHPYLAMYSSWCNGIVLKPEQMLLPIDDHMVHRGDGVFEAIKCYHSKAYLLEAHLQRLAFSAEKVEIPLPKPLHEIQAISHEMLQFNVDQGVLRIFVSRGPGSFRVIPQDSIGSQLYIVLTRFKPLPENIYIKGVRGIRSEVPLKPSWLAQVKSCNYMPNVMMQIEASKKGVDMSISFDSQGFLAEGSTENVLVLTKEGELIYPPFENTLQGITLQRIVSLSSSLKEEGLLSKVEQRSIPYSALSEAKEILLVGTTIDCLSLVELDGKPVGGGRPGKLARRFLELLCQDTKMGT